MKLLTALLFIALAAIIAFSTQAAPVMLEVWQFAYQFIGM